MIVSARSALLVLVGLIPLAFAPSRAFAWGGPKAGSLGGHLRSSHNESAVGRIPKSYPTADWRSAGHALSARTCASRSSGQPTGP